MKRVVVTGMGIISCLGNDIDKVLQSLQSQMSGIVFMPEYKDKGFRSHIAGPIDIDIDEHIDRKLKRFMGPNAAYAYIAMKQAIEQAQLDTSDISNVRTGVIAGSGGASCSDIVETADIARDRGVKRVGPYRVARTMTSSISANLATAFKIKGINYSITSACATSAHCIGQAMEQIQLGKQDIMFAGGGEELHWSQTAQFDAMGALSSKYNDQPSSASRPYCETRDGFVISGGAGILVLEEYEHAKKRGANIIAEIVGYGLSSDGYDMVAPSGEGAQRCMQQAIDMANRPVNYINTHGTSTPVGDTAELRAIKHVFKGQQTAVSSTKALSGHSLGAAGVHEAIYSLLMLKHNFLTGSAHINTLDAEAEGVNIIQENQNTNINTVMSNSFGFGGTNASLIFSSLEADS